MDIGEIQRVWEVEPIEIPEIEPVPVETGLLVAVSVSLRDKGVHVGSLLLGCEWCDLGESLLDGFAVDFEVVAGLQVEPESVADPEELDSRSAVSVVICRLPWTISWIRRGRPGSTRRDDAGLHPVG